MKCECEIASTDEYRRSNGLCLIRVRKGRSEALRQLRRYTCSRSWYSKIVNDIIAFGGACG